jgi:GntR family transcriptional regulator
MASPSSASPAAASTVPPAAGSGATFSPLYQQIKRLLTQSLQAGEWKPGELIPSEIELAARYKVSQGTVRKAIDALAAENLLLRRQGRGTFVATHHEARAQFRFLRLVAESGAPVHPESRFLDCKRVRAPSDIARQLEFKAGDAVVVVRRLLLIEDRPTILDEIWLHGALFKGLTAERLAEYKGPMYGLFESEFGVRMIQATEKLRAVAADATTAELLAVPLASPLLSVERISLTYGDRPVEVRRGLYVTMRHYYENQLG